MPSLGDKRTFLVQLRNSPGWKILERDIREQIKNKERRLRKCADYELDKIQGYLEGLEFPLQKVEESLKGEK